mgnify:CR=1 FL=1
MNMNCLAKFEPNVITVLTNINRGNWPQLFSSLTANERGAFASRPVTSAKTIDVGMVPLDWGYWMMHCHILEHADAGMMTEIHVKP